MTQQTAMMLLRLIDLVALGATMAPTLRASYDDLSTRLKSMVADGRDPTPEEWSTIDAETDRLMREIETTTR